MDSSERTRRSLGQALQSGDLTEQARAFVAGTTGNFVADARGGTVAAVARQHAVVAEQNGVSKTEPAFVPPMVEGIAPITVRLPASVAGRLLRASLERKLRREAPHTQQDIVVEALQTWLRGHGYDR